MHFSIPDTHDLYANATGTASTYTVYNIYINGNYHCSLRFKQLHELHEQLRRRCSTEKKRNLKVPAFPPKRLLPLTNSQLESRRAALEVYLQVIGQDVQLSKMEYFQNFFLRAQINTALAEQTIENDNVSAQIDVVLADGYKVQVNCHVGQNAGSLLQSIASVLKLPQTYLQYLCLYLMRKDATGENLILLRKLMDFESPFISRTHAQPCQFMLRKNYFDPMWDLKLQEHAVALNLLYLQTVMDVEYEWVIAAPDARHKLNSLKQHGLKKEYIELARHLPLYGCVQFDNTIVDYPEPETEAIISIGNKELSIRTPRGAKIYETKFRVTRMRCWRVSAMHNTLESRDEPTHLQLSFEYLMSKQNLRWITIKGAQVMLMSVCLQALVDELITVGSNGIDTANNDDEVDTTAGTSASSTPTSTVPEQPCTSSASASSSSTASLNYMSYLTNSNSTTPGSPTPPVKFLAQRAARQPHKLTKTNTFSGVFFVNKADVHNEAFEGIGDDQL